MKSTWRQEQSAMRIITKDLINMKYDDIIMTTKQYMGTIRKGLRGHKYGMYLNASNAWARVWEKKRNIIIVPIPSCGILACCNKYQSGTVQTKALTKSAPSQSSAQVCLRGQVSWIAVNPFKDHRKLNIKGKKHSASVFRGCYRMTTRCRRSW